MPSLSIGWNVCGIAASSRYFTPLQHYLLMICGAICRFQIRQPDTSSVAETNQGEFVHPSVCHSIRACHHLLAISMKPLALCLPLCQFASPMTFHGKDDSSALQVVHVKNNAQGTDRTRSFTFTFCLRRVSILCALS